MKKTYSPKLRGTLIEIFAGEHYATGEKGVVLGTLLGSCVAACLYDSVAGVIGMNHFLLPGDFRREELALAPNARYGMHAMELLIGSMLEAGARRNRLEAKVFGAGQVLPGMSKAVPQNNRLFIETYLSMEDILTVATDLGGTRGRKILFFADTFTVLVKKIAPSQVYRQDEQYLQRVTEVGY